MTKVRQCGAPEVYIEMMKPFFLNAEAGIQRQQHDVCKRIPQKRFWQNFKMHAIMIACGPIEILNYLRVALQNVGI